jgi:hypothetical protein
MTLLTGDPFFPGGLGEFHCPANEFLVFEDGPSVDVTLQWATYRDASDQTSLSRIWGGIHPPVDDIPGRLIGMELGPAAFEHARKYFEGSIIDETPPPPVAITTQCVPNPFNPATNIHYTIPVAAQVTLVVLDAQGREVTELLSSVVRGPGVYQELFDGRDRDGRRLASGAYFFRLKAITSRGSTRVSTGKMIMVK